MADLGETILNTLKFAAGGEGEVQQRVLNKQTIDANQRKLDKDTNTKFVGKLANSDIYKHVWWNREKDPNRALLEFDVIKAYEDNPDLTVEFMNTGNPQALKFTDEKGRLQQGKIAGIALSNRKNEAGEELYAVEVRRPDGKKTRGGRNPPMTTGASARDDDSVMYFTAAELRDMASTRLWEMRADGSFDNGGVFDRETALLGDAMAVQAADQKAEVVKAIDANLAAGGTDPEIMREIMMTARGLPDTEEGMDALIQIAKDAGVNLDAVFAGLAATNAAEGEAPTEVSDPARDTTGLGNSETMLGGLSKAVSGLGAFAKNPVGTVNDIFGLRAITGTPSAAPASPSAETQAAEAEFQQLALELKKEKAETGYATSPRITQLTKARDEAAKKFFAAQSADAAAAAAPPAATPAKPIGAFDPGANNSFKKAVDAGIAAINPQIEALRQRATGAAPVDSSQSTISPEIMSAPAEVQEAILGEGLSPEERRAAILGALETTLAKPTGKATEYVRDYMIKNGYTSPESLSNAPSAEVMNIAFTIAANADVATTADRLNIAQSLLNFAQFGNTETSALEVAKLQQARTGDSIAAQRLKFDMWKEDNNLDAAETKFADEVYQEAAARAEKIRKAITTKPRMFWQRNPLPAEAVDEFREVMNRAQTEPNATRRAAYQTVAGEIMPEVLAAFIISEPPPGIKEAITGPFENFWLRAPYRQLNTDFGDFRLSYKDDGVTPEFMFLVTPKGDDAEGGQINMLQLTGMFGRETRDFILSAIEKTAELKNAPN
jgi:hypothetical protein